ncbi:hypothetical protein CGI57_22210 [Vibrio parahaemolyticus]|nr:hypothetical protein CGI57_22210 [Vibrio parahaemolyticus]
MGYSYAFMSKNAFRTLFSPKIDVVKVFYGPETFSGFSKKIVSPAHFLTVAIGLLHALDIFLIGKFIIRLLF